MSNTTEELWIHKELAKSNDEIFDSIEDYIIILDKRYYKRGNNFIDTLGNIVTREYVIGAYKCVLRHSLD